MRRQRKKEIRPIEVKFNIRLGRKCLECWRCHRPIIIAGHNPKVVKCRRCESLNRIREPLAYMVCRKCGTGVGAIGKTLVCPACGQGNLKKITNEEFWTAVSLKWRSAEGITRVRDLSAHAIDHHSRHDKVRTRQREAARRARSYGWKPAGATSSAVKVVGRKRVQGA